ncbi:integrase, catalytic region, zinc finger, CCHC-type containing protein [Tanacetum coccineum]
MVDECDAFDSDVDDELTAHSIFMANLSSIGPVNPQAGHLMHQSYLRPYRSIVRFENDHFGAIMGYGDYVIGDSVISRVYYVEGLRHNLFSVGQFYDSDLEVAFRKHSCFVRDLDGVDLIKGSHGTNLYTISVEDKIEDLVKAYLVEVYMGEVFEIKGRNFRFRNQSVKKLQVGLNKTVRFVRTDNGTEFVNKELTDYYESVGITHEKTVPRTPQQNGIAEAVATACYTQNRSLIHTLHDKTPYELVHDKKSDLSFLRVFGALCYPTNDSEDLSKLKAKADIGFFVGYAPNRKGYRIYNKRTRQIMETIHVTFDELTGQTAPVHSSPGPAPILLTPGPISSGTRTQSSFYAPLSQAPVNPTGPSVSIPIDQEAPSGSHSL